MRSREEIDNQIAKFRTEKDELPEFTAFGDNNWETFDAAIRCLEENWSVNDVYNQEYELYAEMFLVSCVEWLQGLTDEIE